MHLKNKDIFIALGIVLLNVVWLLLPLNVPWVGIVLALPLVFFVPGYMLTEILTHTRGLDAFYRLTLSLGLSITLDILGGFLLNIFPFGLRTQSWLALLSCLTLLFASTVFYLRKRVYTNGDATPLPQAQSMLPGNRVALMRDGLLFALAGVLVIVSLLYATRGVAEQPRPGFTQLWMLPASHSAQRCGLDIGIRSFEKGIVTYSAVMTSNGTRMMSWSALVLSPDQTWEQSVIVTPKTPKNLFVQVKLYRNDKPAVVYREVHTTLIVSQQKSCMENI